MAHNLILGSQKPKKNQLKKTQDNNFFFHHIIISYQIPQYHHILPIYHLYLPVPASPTSILQLVNGRKKDGYKVKSPNPTTNRPNPLPHHLPFQPRQPCPPHSCTISPNDHTILLSPNLFLHMHSVCPRPRLSQSRPNNRRMHPRMV